MKWPRQLLLIRHTESAYNALKKQMLQDELYQHFRQSYADHPCSVATYRLAEQVHHRFLPKHGDMATPLAAGGIDQAKQLGRWLRDTQSLPDVVYVSPYVRTWSTLSGIFDSWPELAGVRLIEEERIREQEFGLRLLYTDWRVYLALHPEQQQLFNQQGAYWYRYPQGESVPDIRDRNRSWMNTLVRDFKQQRVLAITHHVSILAFRANMERLTATEFMDLDKHHLPRNGSVTVYNGKPELGQDGKFVLADYDHRLAV
jgi:broad specificity phosphatase PhoE